MADELLKLGLDSSILTLGQPPLNWPHIAPLKLHSGRLENLLGISPSLMRELRNMSYSPSILHGHSVWRLINLFPLFLKKNPEAKVICSPRGALSSWSMQYKKLVKLPFWKLLQKPALNRCNCFHVTSEQEYEDIRQLGFRTPISIVPNGIDLPDCKSTHRRRKKILYLSRINPVKGIDILLSAWESVAPEFPEWELIVAGPLDNDYALTIQALSKSRNIPRLKFFGEALGNTKNMLFSESSLFLLPSYSENFGIAVAEAFAHGVPVITTTGTPWSNITIKRCGWYIDPKQEALTTSLRDALSRPLPELHEMGLRAHQWMLEEYSWQHIATLMQDTYKWLLTGAEQPSCVHLE